MCALCAPWCAYRAMRQGRAACVCWSPARRCGNNPTNKFLITKLLPSKTFWSPACVKSTNLPPAIESQCKVSYAVNVSVLVSNKVYQSSGREFECDYGYVGEDDVCVPYVPPGGAARPPAAPTGPCGKGGQPVCSGAALDGAGATPNLSSPFSHCPLRITVAVTKGYT